MHNFLSWTQEHWQSTHTYASTVWRQPSSVCVHSNTAHTSRACRLIWRRSSLCVTRRSAVGKALTWGDLLEPASYCPASPSFYFWQLAPLTYFSPNTLQQSLFSAAFPEREERPYSERGRQLDCFACCLFKYISMVQHSARKVMQQQKSACLSSN